VRISSESRKSQCAKAREVLTEVARCDEGSTTLLKLKKPACLSFADTAAFLMLG